MKESVFESRDYKAVLRRSLDSRSGSRGYQSRLAESIQCDSAYLSRVLNGTAHLSLEQADKVNRFLGHTPEESHFFLLLVQRQRAGTPTLQEYFDAQIKQVLDKRSVLKERLEFGTTLSPEKQTTYFSSWHYSAIHLLLTVPHLRTREAISKYLGVPRGKVAEVLDFLVSCGLATDSGDSYEVGKVSIHLGNDSAMISKHHTNWRMMAIQSLDREEARELHYSSSVTLAKEDLPKVRNILVGAIEEVRKVVKNSPREEELFCYALDLFRVGN